MPYLIANEEYNSRLCATLRSSCSSGPVPLSCVGFHYLVLTCLHLYFNALLPVCASALWLVYHMLRCARVPSLENSFCTFSTSFALVCPHGTVVIILVGNVEVLVFLVRVSATEKSTAHHQTLCKPGAVVSGGCFDPIWMAAGMHSCIRYRFRGHL